MAKWSIKNGVDGNFDLFHVSQKAVEGVKTTPLTRWPQPLEAVMYWVLEPEQAGFCDVIEMNGRQWGIMDPAFA